MNRHYFLITTEHKKPTGENTHIGSTQRKKLQYKKDER